MNKVKAITGRGHKAVFVDRDDTINQDVHYCSRPQDFKLLPGVGEGIRQLNKEGFLVVLITNQSGIARGYFTHHTLHLIHHKMKADLAQYGARIDAIYYCPHHPEERCLCRKPGTQLVLQAVKEYGIDLGRSFVVGDRLMDVELARRVGCLAVMVPSEPGQKELALSDLRPDFLAPDFLSAVAWILSRKEE